MLSSPLISIIIPIYNAEKYLSNCLDSVCSQTYKNLEIILINDGSKDRSGQICEKYATKDTRIKIIHQENKGLILSRNLGLEKATGEYIGFVDADDEIHPQMYETLLKYSLKYKADIVSCNYLLTQKLKTLLPQEFQAEPIQELTTTADFFMAFADSKIKSGYSDDVGILVWNKLFRKAALPKDIKFEQEYIGAEDAAWLFKLASHIKKIVKLSAVFYIYYKRANSMTTSHKVIVPLNDYRIWKTFVEICQSNKYPAYQKGLQWLVYKAIGLAFLLLFVDTNNVYSSTLEEIISLIRRNFFSVIRYPHWKVKIIVCFLIIFPKFTIWLARTSFINHLIGKHTKVLSYTI